MNFELRALEDNCTWTLDAGFTQSSADHSLLALVTPVGIIVIPVYVDDILIADTDLLQIDHYKTVLSSHFKTKDQGPVKYFLGLEVLHFSTGIFLNQWKYTLDSGQLGAHPTSFPMEQILKLTASDASKFFMGIGIPSNSGSARVCSQKYGHPYPSC